MSEKPKLPEPEIIEKTVRNLRGVCHRLDALTLSLDELIAMVRRIFATVRLMFTAAKMPSGWRSLLNMTCR